MDTKGPFSAQVTWYPVAVFVVGYRKSGKSGIGIVEQKDYFLLTNILAHFCGRQEVLRL